MTLQGSIDTKSDDSQFGSSFYRCTDHTWVAQSFIDPDSNGSGDVMSLNDLMTNVRNFNQLEHTPNVYEGADLLMNNFTLTIIAL